MNGKRFSEDKARKNGFYLALAVCLVAVGIAAWSTYDAVHGYLTPEGEEAAVESALMQKQKEEEVRSGQEVSVGVPAEEDPEAPKPSPSQPARQTAGTVSSRPEASRAESTEPESAAEIPDEKEEQIPVNAPLYEISPEFTSPVAEKEIAKAYSAGAPVYSETMKDWRIHAGTDWEAESGQQAIACANGLVKETYTDGMLGNVAVIEHGDYVFYYCGLGENFLIKAGDVVTKGQAIGTVTAVPGESADEPHLHLEVRRDSAYLDPQTVIEGRS